MTVETCSECGWPRRGATAEECVVALGDIARGFDAALGSVLERGDGASIIQHRPTPEVWSIAEYLAHVAAAMEHIDRRAHLLLTDDDPELPRFGDPNLHDYSDMDVGESLDRLRNACADLEAVLVSASPSELERTGHNALGTASLLATGSYAVHEAGHHLHDVRSIEGLWASDSRTRES